MIDFEEIKQYFNFLIGKYFLKLSCKKTVENAHGSFSNADIVNFEHLFTRQVSFLIF